MYFFLHETLIAAKFVTGIFKGQTVFLPQITLLPSDSDYPFMLKRRQFPIINALL